MKFKEITHGVDSLHKVKFRDVITLSLRSKNLSYVLCFLRSFFETDFWLALDANNKVISFVHINKKKPIVDIIPCSKYLNYNAVLPMLECYMFSCLQYNKMYIRVNELNRGLRDIAFERNYTFCNSGNYLRFSREQYNLNLLEEYQEYDTVVY